MWIPVDERLPATGRDVLVTIETTRGTRLVHIGYWHEHTRTWRTYGCFDVGCKVVAWQERPEPYES